MQKNKFFTLLLTLVFALCLVTLGACGNDDKNGTQDPTTEQQGDNTAPNTTSDTSDSTPDSTNNVNNKVNITVTSPEEDAEVSGGKVTVSGNAQESVTEIKIAMLLDDETVIGEGKALVADVSHEFTTDINYTIPDDKANDDSVDCKIKLTCYDENNKELKQETVHVNIKP